MRPLFAGLLVCILVGFSTTARAADPADLLGKWALTEASAGLPAGTVFDFHKDGKLVISVTGKSVDFKYELNGKSLKLILPNGQSDTTEVVTLTKTELICKDKGGTTGKFKRVP